MSCLSATLTNAVFAYLCIFVFVFVYFQVRHQGTLFLRSSCHYLFKNIAHVMSIGNFDLCCICVFVYLWICICVFASQTPGSIVFEVLVSLPFRKYMVFMVQNLAQLRKFEMSRLWRTHTHTCEVSAVFCWGRIRNWCVKLFSFQTVEAMSSWQLLLPIN